MTFEPSGEMTKFLEPLLCIRWSGGGGGGGGVGSTVVTSSHIKDVKNDITGRPGVTVMRFSEMSRDVSGA